MSSESIDQSAYSDQAVEEDGSTAFEETSGVLLDLIHDVIIIVDSTGRVLSTNKRAVEKLGFTTEELLSRSLNELSTARGREVILANLGKITTGAHVPPFEFEIQRKGGDNLWFEVNATKAVYKGKPSAVMVLRDISKRKEMETELRVRNAAVESSVNAIAISDLDGNLTYVNRAFLEMLGYDNPDEIVGKPALRVWEDEEKEYLYTEAYLGQGQENANQPDKSNR